jgi:hypothetical protein
MPIRLGKIPDETPVKVTIAVKPEIYSALQDYVRIYASEHGMNVKPEDLAPEMIAAFMKSDPAFKRARKTLKQKETTRCQ